jgi:hypothetical protein
VQFVSEISRLGLELGVFSGAMKTPSLLAGLFFAASIAYGGDKQIITMEDGTKLTLLGTTFGNHHMAPGYENMSTANWIYTAPDTTVVWIEEEPEPSKQPIELLVSDRANTGCVNIEAGYRSFVKSGVSLHSFVLSAFPRWDKETILRLRRYRGTVVKGEFVLTNPVPRAIACWTPKPLPDTESDGDLEVTLTKLVAGATTPSWQGGSLAPTNDPANQCVHFHFDFRQNGHATTNWQAWPVQTTDATGNWSSGLIYAYPTNGVFPKNPLNFVRDGYFFEPGLWPNQPWKVRLEFIQRSGFSDDEIVTFTNIPVKPGSKKDADAEWTAWDLNLPFMIPDSTVPTPDTRRRDGKTNFPFTITPGTANGVHLELLPPLLLADEYSTGHPKDVSIIIGADPGFNPKDMNLTVVSATDDQGRDLWSFETPAWAGHYSMEFARVHEDIKSLNLKLALHKSRSVEFTVKPEKAGGATTAR